MGDLMLPASALSKRHQRLALDPEKIDIHGSRPGSKLRQGFTTEQIAECKELFQIFDKDGDGEIDRTEFLPMMKALSTPELEMFFSRMDYNGDGSVQLPELVHFLEGEQVLGVKNGVSYLLRRDRIQTRSDKLQVLVCSLKQQEITEVSQAIASIFPCDVRSWLLLKAGLRQVTSLPGQPELVVVVHRNEGRALLTDRNGFYHEVLGTAWKQTRGNVLVVLTRVEPQEPTDWYDKNMLRSLSTQGDQPTMGVLAHAGRVLTWGSSPSAEQFQQVLKLMTKAYFHESTHAAGIPPNWNKPNPKAPSQWCALL
eukprot:Skav222962  [mRNA]  locus=scaffold1489:778318:788209:- [translate_table: standard]